MIETICEFQIYSFESNLFLLIPNDFKVIEIICEFQFFTHEGNLFVSIPDNWMVEASNVAM